MADAARKSAHVAYLGFGSSLGNRLAHLQNALNRLNSAPNCIQVTAVSSLYESPHLGLEPGDAERFPPHLNCVVAVHTMLDPESLLDAIQRVEAQGHRQRTQRWGPRTIDIDLLLYDRLVYQSDRLIIPHPDINIRSFVINPLYNLVPDLIFPNGQAIRDVIDSEVIRAQRIEQVSSDELSL